MLQNPLLDNTDSIDFAELKPQVLARVGRPNGKQKSGGYSLDGGVTWQPFVTDPTGSRGSGSVAVSADGSTILWTPRGSVPSRTTDLGTTWTAAQGAPTNLHVVTDRVNPADCYGLDARSGVLYRSTDGGATFQGAASGLPTGDSTVQPTPGTEGDLWVGAGKALYHSTDGGRNFSKLDGIQNVDTIGLGKAPPGRTYPAIFTIAEVGGTPGAFRSDDAGRPGSASPTPSTASARWTTSSATRAFTAGCTLVRTAEGCYTAIQPVVKA